MRLYFSTLQQTAFTACRDPQCQHVAFAGAIDGEQDSYDIRYGELPSVDDLEVAAAAAAAAMDEAADHSPSTYSSEDEVTGSAYDVAPCCHC